jgi:hypothetical protein
MTVAGDFYETQAAECARAAAASDLPMLREKYRAAGAAWEALAEREDTIAKARARRIAEETARREEALAIAGAIAIPAEVAPMA